MLTTVPAVYTANCFLSPSFLGRGENEESALISHSTTMSPGSRQASWGQLEARLAAEAGGPPRKAAPPALPSLPHYALTVFLVEELLHLLPEDHLLPEPVGIIFVYERKARGREGPHGLGPGTCSFSHVAAQTPTCWHRLSRARPLLCSLLLASAVCPYVHPPICPHIHPAIPHSLNSFPSTGAVSGTQHPEEEARSLLPGIRSLAGVTTRPRAHPKV